MLSQVLRLLDQLGRQSLGDDLDSQQKAQRARSLGRSPKAVSAPFMKNAKAAGPMRPVVVTTKGTMELKLSFVAELFLYSPILSFSRRSRKASWK